MYHAIVRGKLRRAFGEINAGRYDGIVGNFHPRHEHAFPGRHALGGTRHTLDATRRWYERLAALLPDLRFELRSIAVSGWPWDTRALVEWTDTFTVDGQPQSNQGVHAFRLRWGRVTGLSIYCDTQKLEAVCRAKGLGDAAPITD